MSRETKELNLPSRIESIEKAALEAQNFAAECGLPEDALFGVDMAVREAVANAVKHGNKEDETKPVEIGFRNSDEGFEVTVRDYGAGFKVEEIPDPTDPENLLKASGRGILFMRSFMDEVDWTSDAKNGTVVRMLKRK